MKHLPFALFLGLCPLVCAQAPAGPGNAAIDLADGLWQRAKNLYAAGANQTDIEQRIAYFLKAAELFAEFQQRYPAHREVRSAQYYQALCLYNAGNVDAAKAIFTQIITTQRTGPYVAAASSAMAGDAFEKKDYATAAALYAKLAANAVKPADRQRGHYFEALSHHYRQREREALTAYRKVLDDPDAAQSPYLHLCRNAVGALLLKEGKAQEALPFFEEILRSAAPEKSRAEASFYAGITCLQLKETARADGYFQQILSQTHPDWQNYRADALTSVMQLRFQEKKYAEVVRMFRAHPLSTGDERQAKRTNLAARSFMLIGSYLEAIPLFLDVQKLAPDTTLAFDASYHRLLCFYQIDGKHIVEQVDAFLEIYEKTHKSHPRLHAALMMKAGALQNQGKLAEAASTYELIDTSLIAENNRANLQYQRGWCLAKVKNYQAAIRSLDQFIKDYPRDKRHAEAMALRGDCYLETGDRESALKDFTRLIESEPGAKLAAYAWQKTAIVKKQNNDLPGMVASYETLLRKFPSLPPATVANAAFYIGYGQHKQNQHKAAIPQLLRAREMDRKTYGRRAGLLLISSYYQSEQIQALCEEIDESIEHGYSDQVSPALVSWAGVQSLNQGKGEQAARFFMLIANPEEPRRTPREVWRHLAKALILCREYDRSLKSIEHVLDVEEQAQAQADALLDQARCYLALKKPKEARKSIEACFERKPQGALEAEASIVFGDILMALKLPQEAQERYAGVALLIEDARLKPLAISRLIQALEANQDFTKAEQYRKELKEQFPQWKEEPLPRP